MTKYEKVIEERIKALNEWLEKTKDIKSPGTLANTEGVKKVLCDFKNLDEILPMLVMKPSYEAANEVNNLMATTIDELISHNTNILNDYQKMINSLQAELDKSVSPIIETQDALESYQQLYKNLKEHIENYKAAKYEINVLIEKAVESKETTDDESNLGVDFEEEGEFPI